MASISPVLTLLKELPPAFTTIAAPITLLAILAVFTRVYTTVRYQLSLSEHLHKSSSSSQPSKPILPPHIPYTFPFLGSAISFLAPKPGLFWTNLFRTHPRSTGACTLLLGGKVTHVIFSPSAVQALFKSRGISRDIFNVQILRNSLGVPKKDVLNYSGMDAKGQRRNFEKVEQDPVHVLEKVHADTLLRTDRVNELTAEWQRMFQEQLANSSQEDGQEIGLYAWLRSAMFKTSSKAFMGDRLAEMYPNYEEDYWCFDSIMLALFFGIPRIFIPKSYKIRDNVLSGLQRWHEAIQQTGKEKPVDPDGDVVWEPIYGSRANRARQRFYQKLGLSTRARAGLDLGFIFAVASNAIPAAGWMLAHIVDPHGDKTLLPRILEELETVRLPDGGVDMPTLVSLPLFQSVYCEILRLYTDVLVSREVHEDLSLPVDSGRRNLLIKKGGVVMAPTWLGHYDPEAWSTPSHPFDTFYAERFLTTNAETGKNVFTLNGTAGKWFAYGGGKNGCPGRVFAKQEILGAVAMVLLEFRLDAIKFVDGKGEDRHNFPGLRQAYGGTGVMAMDGDIVVRIAKRTR